ncbi:MAG: hypothetical protein AW10_00010 [Candidatus Accumulibacter appositus]|uniref:Uncharacterized protein n=1 Tax=Candidatus Accumulibacter appositus TaxID=1454003 RepID=A0A011QWN7_9PROT|nr:MAG: hypothetical protein AW10_00010 [Candidatus Accumulibacter appositus]
MPSADKAHNMRGEALAVRRARAVRAMMPPSPLLSARMMNSTYLRETVIVSAQKTSDKIPRTVSVSIGSGW